MKLYAVQYTHQVGGQRLRLTRWCATIQDATAAYEEQAEHQPVIRIISMPAQRDSMADWLNRRHVPESPTTGPTSYHTTGTPEAGGE